MLTKIFFNKVLYKEKSNLHNHVCTKLNKNRLSSLVVNKVLN